MSRMTMQVIKRNSHYEATKDPYWEDSAYTGSLFFFRLYVTAILVTRRRSSRLRGMQSSNPM
jgi:hypothetical protein